MMINLKITKNPFLLFLPFLLVYVVIIVLFPTSGTFGDENKYLVLAHNLINGFYSGPPPDIHLGNGPGYPILLIPFVVLRLPLICITLLNGILYYLSVVYLYKSMNQVTSEKISLFICLFWALYVNLYEYLPLIYTETFTIFLVTMLIFNLLKAFNTEREKKHLLFSGFLLGYLALTKPIFGYVIMFLLVATALLWIINIRSANFRRGFLIVIIGLLVTSPYLIYSYHLSGRAFYWGTNGGNNLYWMSTPYDGEYGNWIEYPTTSKERRIPSSEVQINKNHKQDFDEIFKYRGVDRDDVYKNIALKNIKSHPTKFIYNCFCNLGRILFNYPYSYELERPESLLRLPMNGVILLFIVFCAIPTLLNWKKIPFSIRLLLFVALLYLGGSILGSAETRMFTMIVPVLLLWIAYIIERTVKINLKINGNTSR